MRLKEAVEWLNHGASPASDFGLTRRRTALGGLDEWDGLWFKQQPLSAG